MNEPIANSDSYTVWKFEDGSVQVFVRRVNADQDDRYFIMTLREPSDPESSLAKMRAAAKPPQVHVNERLAQLKSRAKKFCRMHQRGEINRDEWFSKVDNLLHDAAVLVATNHIVLTQPEKEIAANIENWIDGVGDRPRDELRALRGEIHNGNLKSDDRRFTAKVLNLFELLQK